MSTLPNNPSSAVKRRNPGLYPATAQCPKCKGTGEIWRDILDDMDVVAQVKEVCGCVLCQIRERESKAQPVTREMDLHKQIMAYCDSQWPKWKYIRARSDMKSTIAVGAPDFSIAMPGGRILFVECKKAKAKPTAEQAAWHKELEMLGHKVWVCRSMDDFMEAIK